MNAQEDYNEAKQITLPEFTLEYRDSLIAEIARLNCEVQWRDKLIDDLEARIKKISTALSLIGEKGNVKSR